MRAALIGLIFVILLMLTSASFAYSGFNRYYYTDNYYPTTYYAAPYANSYYYPTSYYYPSYTYSTYYPVVTYTAPTYYYPTNYYSGYTSGVSVYGTTSSGNWGFSVTRSNCGYYGYC